MDTKQKKVTIRKIFSLFLRNYHLVTLVGILAVGAFMRLYRIREYMTFLGDEGRDVIVVRKMITEFDITFLGPTASVGGFFLGPIYYYFMTPFLWIFNMDPVGPAVMVAIFGVATIYLVYRVGELFMSRRTGLIASALYALSPLVIAHSRSSWNPNIVPFFSLLYILGLYKAVFTKNKWWYFIVGMSLGVGIQLHYLFTFLIPVGIVYLVMYDHEFNKYSKYIYGAVGFLMAFGAFLAFEIKNGFPNTITIFKFIIAGDEVGTGQSNPIAIVSDVSYRLFARLVFFFPPPEQITIKIFNIHWWWMMGIIVVIFISIGMLLFRLYTKRRKKDVLLTLWLIFGIGIFSIYQREIYDYYFTIMFALPFLLVSDVLARMMSYRVLKYIAIFLLVGLLYLNWLGQPFQYAPNNQIRNVERIAREVLDVAGDKEYNFALLTSGNSDHAYRYFLEVWKHPPTTIIIPEFDPERKTVTDQLIVLCEYSTCEPIGNPLWEIAGFGPAKILSKKDIGLGMIVFKLVHVSPEMVQ